ncbi:hypothetical protein SAY86_010845 [Trapa natans]|uniref:Polygalacturonase n=1 Tax=Trapa natans TaxID=22666 RepID=A0AAN7LW21_TRANT|nr:hypothetical protein SAY86_010845 [Trapa natans]
MVFAALSSSFSLAVFAKSNHHISLSHPISDISVPLSPVPEPAPGPNQSQPTGIFDVRKFGATSDGFTDDTDAFKLAWDTACGTGGGSANSTILVPRGHSFVIQPTIFTGPCNSSIVFQIDGTVMLPDGPESWPLNKSKRQWLVFYRINGMSMQGDGLIDGKGQKWWNLPCKPHKGVNGTTKPGPCDSPVALRFFMSNNLTVQGLKIKDSPQFHFRFDGCQNVLVQSLTIKAPALSPNTDGIHIENTNNVEIYDSIISTGNHKTAISYGDKLERTNIGSLGVRNSSACVSNITVTDSKIMYSKNGLRIKTWQGGSGAVSKFHMSLKLL